MCDREVGQALSREKCPVGTVDLEPELGDTRVGVANPRSFIFNTGLEIGPDKFVEQEILVSCACILFILPNFKSAFDFRTLLIVSIWWI